MVSNSLVKKYSTAINKYIDQSDHMIFVELDSNCLITYNNSAFGKIMQSKKSIIGEKIHSFLLKENHHIFPFTDNKNEKKTKLNFKQSDFESLTLECHVFKVDDGYIILGDHLTQTNTEALQKISLITNNMTNLSRELHKKNKELQEAHSKIKILRGIVPICSYCKEIRDDKGFWNQLEKYISEHSDAEFSHSICPNCLEKHFSEYSDK